MKIGRITLRDPALPDELAGKMDAEIERAIGSIFLEQHAFVSVVVPPEAGALRAALIRLCDEEKCPLVFTTGGAGPKAWEIAPETTREIFDRELPGFGEVMRSYSYERAPASILSRATAGSRGRSLIVNLPGRPRSIRFCLKVIREAVAEGLEHLSGTRPVLRGDEIVVPLEKYLPFLKFMRVKPDPRDVKDPRQKLGS
jgi:molybdopterin adenylyltransferase